MSPDATKKRDEAGPDGSSYVEAVIAAGQRSRAIISVVLVLMVLTFTSLRNNYEPAWNYTRIQVYEDLYDCLSSNDFNHANCAALKMRIEVIKGRQPVASDVKEFADNAEIELRGEFGSGDFRSVNQTKMEEVKKRYEALISKDAEGAAIAIPVLGSQIDFNDLWLVSGVIMFFLLYMLYASIEQEYRNVRFIAEHKRSYLQLVVMNQVLSVLRAQNNPIAASAQKLVWLSPALLYIYLFWSDLHTYQVSVAFVGRARTIGEYFFEGVTVLAVVYANVRCVMAQAKLQEVLRDAASA
jgi:hypothetical protein